MKTETAVEVITEDCAVEGAELSFLDTIYDEQYAETVNHMDKAFTDQDNPVI